MSKEHHGERVEILKDTMRKLDIPLSSSTSKSPLENKKPNRIVNPRVRGTPQVVCHNMCLGVFSVVAFEFRTIARDLGGNWGLIWIMKNRIIR